MAMINQAKFLANLPLDLGEAVVSMAAFPLAGANCIALCTTQGRLFVLQIGVRGEVLFAGPMIFEAKE
jgi:hypothetical protein